MTVSLCTDEHVPGVFVTALRSTDFDVVRAKSVFGERTDDRRLLEYCAEEDLVFLTHDKKDFAGAVGNDVDHAGIVIYTSPRYLRDDPGNAVDTLERVFEYYPPEELTGERIWLDQWRDAD